MEITTTNGGHIMTSLSKPEVWSNTAKLVQEHCAKNKLVHNIRGKKYPSVEAWQFAGNLMGLIPVLLSCTNISTDTEIKYMATATLQTLDGRQVGGIATMICSKKEHTKKSFDEYAICSMAQTRAIGKAYRLVIGWLFKAAGFEATPAEEMDFVKSGNDTPPPPPQERDINGLRFLLTQCNTKAAIKKLYESIPKEERPATFRAACIEREEKIKKVTKWNVPSESSKKVSYTVSESIAGGWGCTCTAKQMDPKKDCKHINLIKPAS